ncbi:hypothetical protein M1466_00780 [Candidatus Dependentiae bacterium]|nr:hypothetical protein [Candidatus Dependentiae bacterium]
MQRQERFLCILHGIGMLFATLLLCSQQNIPIAVATNPIKIERATSAPAVLKIYAVTNDSPMIALLVNEIAMHLGASQQFAVTVMLGKPLTTKQEFMAIAGGGTAMVLYCTMTDSALHWRLLDGTGGESLVGKKSKQGDRPVWRWAADVADQIWHAMTSRNSDFSSVIIACKKEKKRLQGRQHRTMRIIHPTFGSQWGEAVVLVDAMSDNFAPRVHPTLPFVYFSQHTPTNIRLMVTDTDRRCRIVTNFDGQNLTPAIHAQGKIIVCLSHGDATHLYEYRFCLPTGKGEFVQITHGKGHYVSPSFVDSATLVAAYIDDALASTIQLINLTTQQVTKLSIGRAYCPVGDGNGRIAYCKKAQGVLQVWLYDTATGKERQLTSSPGDKDEPTWSPSGTALAVASHEGGNSRIIIVDATTGKQRAITPVNEQWSCPAWAPTNYAAAFYRRHN